MTDEWTKEGLAIEVVLLVVGNFVSEHALSLPMTMFPRTAHLQTTRQR